MSGKNGRLSIELVRGMSAVPRKQRESLRALGLRRIRQSVVREDTPSIRGMIDKVRHLVRVEEIGQG